MSSIVAILSKFTLPERKLLLTSLFLLLSISLLMIASASVPYATANNYASLNFFWSQLIFILVGVVAGFIVYKLPIDWYCNTGMLIVAEVVIVFLLLLTLLVGKTTNGATRWLDLGPFDIQVAEFAKLIMVLIISDYVVRRSSEVRSSMLSGYRLFLIYLPILLLLIMQPDYGSMAVISATAMVILLVSGVPVRHYLLVMTVLFIPVMIFGIFASDYRRERILSFWDPFDDTGDSDFQLARSLIAFGRGEFSGVGYGNSVQKLAHLPEAHTDFILAVTGEELGFIGVSFVIFLEAMIVLALMKMSFKFLRLRQLRFSYSTFGFAVIIFGQTMINAGMNMGLMPTKGLTLPFFSYGGSSIVMMLTMIALALKMERMSPILDKEQKNRAY